MAVGQGLLDPGAREAAVIVAAISMFLVPYLAAAGRYLARRNSRRGGVVVEPQDAQGLSDHVVIGGFGRVGQAVAERLEAKGIAYIAFDPDPGLVASEHAAGRPVFLGDASRGELLERAHSRAARAFVVTVDERAAAEEMVRTIRDAWPDAIVHARAKDSSHADTLLRLGATTAVPEVLDASAQLALNVLESITGV